MMVHSPRMIAGLAMLSLGFFDGILGVAWLSIHDDLGVSLESLGWVLGAVGVGSAFGSAMFPTVVRNLSHLNVLALSLGVQAIVCMLVILTNQYWLLVILYAARGFFNGLAHASLNAYFAQRISPQHLMNIHGGWGVGTALAGFLCGVLITTDWGWEPVYLIGGTLSFSAMGVIFWTRHHFGHLDVMPSESLSGAFRVSVPVFFAIASGALYVGLEQGVGNWISSLLVSIDGAQIHQAGLATGFFWTGLTVGRLTLTRIPVASNQMLKWASGSIVVVLLLLLWIPSEFKIVMYAGLGIAMAPMSAFILVAGARLVPSARRDLMMALQVLAFSVGAAVIPSTLGGIASLASMTILPWVFLAVATLLIVSIWITVRD